jgi:hypothetical protein
MPVWAHESQYVLVTVEVVSLMSNTTESPQRLTDRFHPLGSAAWSVIAAFGAYFCMYGFRKPFTAAAFKDGTLFGLDQKSVLVTAQVLGYMISKFLGIRFVSETRPEQRVQRILLLIMGSEIALLVFGIAPPPLHVLGMFLNGLCLGMVFGFVVGFLEGKANTEALTAGLCSSFILAGGVTKSIGTTLIDKGVSEHWMPAVAGLIYIPPLLGFLAMLRLVPPPSPRDIELRSHRHTMDRHERAALVRRNFGGLLFIELAFLLVTVARSLRDDFAPEIWRGLGVSVVPTTFSQSEFLVAFGVLLLSGLTVFIVDNRKAFLVSVGVSIAGGLLMIFALVGLRMAWINAFWFMVIVGTGLYLPYMAVHTTIFERLLAMTREKGNLGFLMTLADFVGYLGYVVLLLGKGFLPDKGGFLPFFTTACWIIAVVSVFCFVQTWLYYRTTAKIPEVEASVL